MNGARIASVWVEDIKQWVPMSHINVLQWYTHEGKSCVQFSFDGKVQESYVEYVELN
jgi:hypothetical protein